MAERTFDRDKLAKPFPPEAIKQRKIGGAEPNVTCDSCGESFRVRPYKLKQQHHFCSRSCQGQWRSQQTGELAAHWKGGIKIERGGRVKLYRPEHPCADDRGYVWRHRLNAEESIGRLLCPEEVVHHLDGDVTNDDPANLQVLPDQATHARLHGQEISRDRIERWYRASPNYKKHEECR